LLASADLQVSGLLLPGHVSTIVGAAAYDFIPRDFHLPCAVTGFEPLDILLGVEALLTQIKTGKPQVANAYSRAVSAPANPRARQVLEEVFQPAEAFWRGLGLIPGSGVSIRPEYARFDAGRKFAAILDQVPPPKATPCRCGEVLRGILPPPDCPLFGTTCTPSQPLGPCMVSTEGACAAAYRFG
jgi:hydrogenase expression/formation protein HypD